MSVESFRSNQSFRTQYNIGETVADHRARIAREQEEIDQRRMEALAGQVSVINAPSERIRIWEQLHGLSLPSSPGHKLVGVIAAATDLQLEQVHEVQRLRMTGTNSTPAAVLPST